MTFKGSKTKKLDVYLEVGVVNILQLRNGLRFCLIRLKCSQGFLSGCCMIHVQKMRPLKRHLPPFHRLNNPFFRVLEVVQIVGATRWVEIMFKTPDCLNKVLETPKYQCDSFWPFWKTCEHILWPLNLYCSNLSLHTHNDFCDPLWNSQPCPTSFIGWWNCPFHPRYSSFSFFACSLS